jgi:hypothetical protein
MLSHPAHHRPYHKKVLCVRKRNGERIRAWEPRRETHFRRVAKAGARAELSIWLCYQWIRDRQPRHHV